MQILRMLCGTSSCAPAPPQLAIFQNVYYAVPYLHIHREATNNTWAASKNKIGA